MINDHWSYRGDHLGVEALICASHSSWEIVRIIIHILDVSTNVYTNIQTYIQMYTQIQTWEIVPLPGLAKRGKRQVENSYQNNALQWWSWQCWSKSAKRVATITMIGTKWWWQGSRLRWMLTMICRQLTLEKNKQLGGGGGEDDEAGDDVEPVPWEAGSTGRAKLPRNVVLLSPKALGAFNIIIIEIKWKL